MERAELARLLGAPARAGRAAPRAVVEADPGRFAVAFARAVAAGGPVFLGDPAWGPAERAVLRECLAQARGDEGGAGWLMIPSGGTSGRLKFARHDADTLAAAVAGFRAHFRADRVHCVGVLPLHHVSGLMAWMRALMSGGEYLPWEWRRLERGDRPSLPDRGGFRAISLVPTQLQRLLASRAAAAWLRGFDAVMAGGGPLWPDLEDAARSARLPLSPGYGMTETAAMVAAQRPADFLRGESGLPPMPHARFSIAGRGGRIAVAGPSLFRGYFPARRRARSLTTQDAGRIDAAGRLHVLGRSDAVVITGGKKVAPGEVEAALRASGQFADVAVLGVADPEWGQAVVACYPAAGPKPDLDKAAAALRALAAYKRPRRFVPLSPWPRNAQGKLNRAELARLAQGPGRAQPVAP